MQDSSREVLEHEALTKQFMNEDVRDHGWEDTLPVSSLEDVLHIANTPKSTAEHSLNTLYSTPSTPLKPGALYAA